MPVLPYIIINTTRDIILYHTVYYGGRVDIITDRQYGS